MTSVEGKSVDDGLDRLVKANRWTHPPERVDVGGDRIVVTAVPHSDAWQHTSYDFVHDSEHALLEPLGTCEAVEVSFILDFSEAFDQAGVFLRAAEDEWIKAGIEVSDGEVQVGAVVTHGTSDWSVAPVPEWVGRVVTVRASRAGDAVTIRARVDDEPYRLVRLARVDPALTLEAGLFCASPSRGGLRVTFTGYGRGPADASLH